MSLKLVVLSISLMICLVTDVVESKPCDIRRWSGCRDISKMSTDKPTLTLSISKSKYFLFYYLFSFFIVFVLFSK